MNEELIQEIIDKTVTATVAKLKLSGLMKDDGLSAFQKTEQILKSYNDIKKGYSEKGMADKFLCIVDDALKTLEDDPYYDVIPMIYFENKTREQIAEEFDVSVTTISNHKTRLVTKLVPLLFSDNVVIELFL